MRFGTYRVSQTKYVGQFPRSFINQKPHPRRTSTFDCAMGEDGLMSVPIQPQAQHEVWDSRRIDQTIVGGMCIVGVCPGVCPGSGGMCIAGVCPGVSRTGTGNVARNASDTIKDRHTKNSMCVSGVVFQWGVCQQPLGAKGFCCRVSLHTHQGRMLPCIVGR